MSGVTRFYVEKRPGCGSESVGLLRNLREYLGLNGLKGVRVFNRYDVDGLREEEIEPALKNVFSEPPVDLVYIGRLPQEVEGFSRFVSEYLPGQYDQRADSAEQCLALLLQRSGVRVVTAKIVVLEGQVTPQELAKAKSYFINPVDSREASEDLPETLQKETPLPGEIPLLVGFREASTERLKEWQRSLGLAMAVPSLVFLQERFRQEKRDPTETEIKVLDTYWSDHCRHTTFHTPLQRVEVEDSPWSEPLEAALKEYLLDHKRVYGEERPLTLMRLALGAMKLQREEGGLEDLELSEEINAASIKVKVDVEGGQEDWLVMFKNETHNHPTEIEPFGGAATCLGGAIRDPLSGRTYVYHAMRVTGCGDPRTPLSETLPGKLPQRKITLEAAQGYSAYGNQIGLATGLVREIYHPGYAAKRLEIGAVVGAAPLDSVVRGVPEPGDPILLVGGRTGRDGCGGATGSSKAHDKSSLETAGAEVQKGNPPTERKLQRFFRNPEVAKRIKRCNDFGAGGVSVAVGELAPGVLVDLDKVLRKYEGLNGTELAISESQERMALVCSPRDEETLLALADRENLEATVVARVTEHPRMVMRWRGETIVDLSRELLDSQGVIEPREAYLCAPHYEANPFLSHHGMESLREKWLHEVSELGTASQKGLGERFDGSIGAGALWAPYGGDSRETPTEVMGFKLPLSGKKTTTSTVMTFGFDPWVSSWSPFHGAIFGGIEALAKLTAVGADYRKARLTLQEYFEKLREEPKRWGKPLAALLGSYLLQRRLKVPAVGGKDSMSGSFENLDVPPTLVTFAISVEDERHLITPEFKRAGSRVVYVPLCRDRFELPEWDTLESNFSKVRELIASGKILAAEAVGRGGLAIALTKMVVGNGRGFRFTYPVRTGALFTPDYGSLVLEVPREEDCGLLLEGIGYQVLGETTDRLEIEGNGESISLHDLKEAWKSPLEEIFPDEDREHESQQERRIPLPEALYREGGVRKGRVRVAKPRVLIPVFPGTNCEDDSAEAFRRAGGDPEVLVFRNLSIKAVQESIEALDKALSNAQILMIPGGFSAGDEPDGSGKFISAVFRNPRLMDGVHRFLGRDGLILGICNGFQALLKLGLLTHGEIRPLQEDSPTLTFNRIGRHVASVITTRVASNLSPWMSLEEPGTLHQIPVSHGEGRFVAPPETLEALFLSGQVAAQYVDDEGRPRRNRPWNPNGSWGAVEALSSPDGRVLGKMAHTERVTDGTYRNIPGIVPQRLFEGGVSYFL